MAHKPSERLAHYRFHYNIIKLQVSFFYVCVAAFPPLFLLLSFSWLLVCLIIMHFLGQGGRHTPLMSRPGGRSMVESVRTASKLD